MIIHNLAANRGRPKKARPSIRHDLNSSNILKGEDSELNKVLARIPPEGGGSERRASEAAPSPGRRGRSITAADGEPGGDAERIGNNCRKWIFVCFTWRGGRTPQRA